MLAVAFFRWWYGAGWLMLARKAGAKAQRALAFFSVRQLAGSFFAPYKQISAYKVQGPPSVQLRAFGDRLLSRAIGAVIRSFLIVIGLGAALLCALFGMAMMLIWPLVPVFPIAGAMMAAAGASL